METQRPRLLPEDVTELRNSMYLFVGYLDDVKRGYERAVAQQDPVYQRPHISEWPGNVPGDPSLTRPNEIFQYDGAADSRKLWTERGIGWPRILDQLLHALEQFWDAFESVGKSLDELSKRVVSCLDATAGSYWKVRVRRWLNEISEWCYESRPNKTPNHREIDLCGFLQVLDKPEPEWWNWTKTWKEFDDDLRALIVLSSDETAVGNVEKSDPPSKNETSSPKKHNFETKKEFIHAVRQFSKTHAYESQNRLKDVFGVSKGWVNDACQESDIKLWIDKSKTINATTRIDGQKMAANTPTGTGARALSEILSNLSAGDRENAIKEISSMAPDERERLLSGINSIDDVD